MDDAPRSRRPAMDVLLDVRLNGAKLWQEPLTREILVVGPLPEWLRCEVSERTNDLLAISQEHDDFPRRAIDAAELILSSASPVLRTERRGRKRRNVSA